MARTRSTDNKLTLLVSDLCAVPSKPGVVDTTVVVNTVVAKTSCHSGRDGMSTGLDLQIS